VTRIRLAWMLPVLAAGVLAACSGGDQAGTNAAQTVAAPAWLAVARGQVDVEGGLVRVAAQRDGVIRSVAVRQGDQVKAGQVLAQLDPRAAEIAVNAAKAGVEQARAQLAELDVQWRQARQRAPRVTAAAKAGAATGEAAEQAREAVVSLQAQRDAAEAALEGARQKLAAAQFDLDAMDLRAPVAGVVVFKRAVIGQSVAAASGETLFEILPDRPHIVRAQVDADAAGAIKPGMRAEVVRDTGTGPVYPATVLWVGQVLQPATLSEDPLQRAVANDVDCTLRLEPPASGGVEPPPLRIGQRVLVRFPKSG